MTSPFSSNPFDDDFFKKDHFGTGSSGGGDLDKTVNRVFKGIGCFAIVYVLGFILLFAGLIALIWKFVLA